jgi:hypothetical protein
MSKSYSHRKRSQVTSFNRDIPRKRSQATSFNRDTPRKRSQATSFNRDTPRDPRDTPRDPRDTPRDPRDAIKRTRHDNIDLNYKVPIIQDEKTRLRFEIYNGLTYPVFKCFTLQPSTGDNYVITIHDTTLFEEHEISVCVGSHGCNYSIMVQRASTYPPRQQIMIIFKCHDCNKRESECGPFNMYHIVHHGIPKVLCKTCWTDSGKYPKYDLKQEQLFYQLLSKSEIATVQPQRIERLDTFIVNNNNERERLT